MQAIHNACYSDMGAFAPTNCQITTRRPWSFAPGHDGYGAHGPVGSEVSGSSAFKDIQAQRQKLINAEKEQFAAFVSQDKQAYEVHFKAHQEAVKHAEAFEKGCRENEVAHSISGIAAHQRDVQAHSAALSYPHSMAGRASAYGPAYGAGYHHGGYGRGFGVGYGQGYGHGVYR